MDKAITITHTRADGTLLEGSRKGDGVYEIVRRHGFRYFPSIGAIGIGQSRDKAAQTWKINGAAEALRAAGWTVEIDIREDERRSFEEAEAERVQRAEERAGRYAGYAGNAAERSNARHDAAMGNLRGIEPGQPILVGHHSERGHRRALERHDTNMRASIEEQGKAEHYANRAAAAAAYERHRNDIPRTLRRIAKLEADLRKVRRYLDGYREAGRMDCGHAQEMLRREAEYTEQLDYWRALVAKAEADGFKVWGKTDFRKGDFARIGGRWYEVLRANAKTLTVPGGPDIQPVISQETRRYSWNDTAPYDGVTGRMSAQEMREHLASQTESV